jgi:putative ABC transport system permease protein
MMPQLRRFLSRLHNSFRRGQAEHELNREVTAHLALIEHDYRRRGMTAEDARLAARRAFGGVEYAKELHRDERAFVWLDHLRQDVQYACRTVARNPGFTLVAVLTLALGIGANTAMFSVVNAVILRPLPYRDADRLVRISESNPGVGRVTASVSQPNFLDWRARAKTFSALAATQGTTLTLTSGQGAEMVIRGESVTAEFLPVLGVSPAVGRNFLPDESRPGGDTRVVILGDGFWKRAFASDPSILGRQIGLGGVPSTVVGVLPPSFRWQTEAVDVLVPLQPDPSASRGDRQLNVIGRLAEGMTIGRAQDELSGIAADLARQYPDADNGWSVRTLAFSDWLIPASVRASLAILLAAITLVLLIACANVANLLLARAAARQKELSIRIALGAARSRIVRQLLTESLLLALIAGALGVAGGAAAIRLLVAYGPATVPRLGETSFDLRVLLFAVVVSVATALVFGMAPALLASRQSPAATMRQATAGATSTGRQRLRSVMTVVEIALSVVLLIGAGLLLRSLWRLQQVDPGFNPSPLMTVRAGLPSSTYPNNEARGAFYERLLAEVRALPGIAAAAASSGLPLAGCCSTSTEFQVPGAEDAGGRASAGWRLVSPGYFAAMGIPLRGRELSSRDRGNSQLTIIISEAMARQYWPNQDPIGQTVTLDTFSASGGNRPRTIIGVAGDVRHVGLDAESQSMVYYSTVERGAFGGMGIVWRSSVDPASHVAAVNDLVRRIDPMVPLFSVQSLDDLLANSFAPRKFDMYLFGAFAGVALLLAAIGLFGLTSYNVSQRIREIGLRRALGAEPRDILRLILGRGITLAATGAVIGICAAFGLTRLMQSLLFSVSTTDPGTFVAVPAILVLVAILACYIPARHATKVDPMVALRYE